jgi:hypothetical protein
VTQKKRMLEYERIFGHVSLLLRCLFSFPIVISEFCLF